MTESEQATKIANDWLDFKMNSLTQLVPGDPDCDACVVARQFIRTQERAARFEEAISNYLAGNYSCQGGAERLFNDALGLV